jgi:branched-chain amino acid aminotransferase
MKALVSVNGELFEPKDARISIFDRGFLYGDSIYEVTEARNGTALFMDLHMERLWSSAAKIELTIPHAPEFIVKESQKIIDALGLPRSYIRIIVTRGEGEIGLDPGLSHSSNLVIIGKELAPNPSSWYEKGVWMVIADTRRLPKKVLDPNLKSGNYLSNVMAIHEAKKRGAFDAILLNLQGQVTEGTTNNIWMVKNGQISTPPVQAGLLEGITRQTLLKLGQQHGLDMREANFTPEELKGADEAFLTSTTREIVPITRVDDQLIGGGRPGPVAQRLHQLYRDYVQQFHGLS